MTMSKTVHLDNDELIQPLLFPPDKKSLKYYKQVIPVNIHHFYIVDEINEVDPYLELINTLKTAEAHDSVYIYINSPGGNLHTAIQVISAIKQSQATVITSLDALCCSAATLIFLSGHKFMVNPNCTFMIHNYSNFTGGKGNELALQVKHQEEHFKTLAQDIYGGFLTAEEITSVLNGKDIWLGSKDVVARLKANTIKKKKSENEPSEEIPAKSKKKFKRSE